MAKKKQITEEDDALLAELGIEVEVKKTSIHSVIEERVVAGFEEIQTFVDENGYIPVYAEHNDIFERLYAIRLDQIRKHPNFISLLKERDHQGLLTGEYQPAPEIPEDIDDDELLAKLGVNENAEDAITNLRHVKSRAEKREAEEIANRSRCEDFAKFKPLFDAVKRDIKSGYRETIRFRKDAGFTKTTLKVGNFIIIAGQLAYIDQMGEFFKAPNGEDDARLRVIYDNETESNILLRSLIRAMYKDETSRFLTEENAGPLFSNQSSDDDIESGVIYVLRSLSDHPVVKEHRNLVHKIGVTGGDVKTRISNAKYDPTYLMADVEIIATYKLANLNRTKLEKIFHRFLSAAKLNIEVKDRFGKSVKAQEWFLVPLFIIDQMVDKIKDGTVADYIYDPSSAEIRKA